MCWELFEFTRTSLRKFQDFLLPPTNNDDNVDDNAASAADNANNDTTTEGANRIFSGRTVWRPPTNLTNWRCSEMFRKSKPISMENLKVSSIILV